MPVPIYSVALAAWLAATTVGLSVAYQPASAPKADLLTVKEPLADVSYKTVENRGAGVSALTRLTLRGTIQDPQT
jgi:hypothetical protein